MPANTSPIFGLTPVCQGTQFTSSDTTSKKTLFTAGANGAHVDDLSLCSNDTAAINLALYINDGSTDYYYGVVNVPIGSGYTTVPKVNGIATVAPPSLGAINLPGGYLLKGACVLTMTAAKTLDVVVQAENF